MDVPRVLSKSPYVGIIQIRFPGRRSHLPLSLFTSSPFMKLQTKTGDTLPDASCKKSYFDFLRRHYPHQVKGSKVNAFLSACLYKLPCVLFYTVYARKFENARPFVKNTDRSNNRRHRKSPTGFLCGRLIDQLTNSVYTS